MMIMMMSEFFDVLVVVVLLCLLFMNLRCQCCVLFNSGLVLLLCWFYEGETQVYLELFMLRTRDLAGAAYDILIHFLLGRVVYL